MSSNMEDNLHPHDLTYKKRHPEEQSGTIRAREASNNERHYHFRPIAGA
jgi:hypothetical protein